MAYRRDPGVALLGACRAEAYEKALAGARGLHVVGCASEPEAAARLLQEKRVAVVFILAACAQREYWVRQAAGMGKEVFCLSPWASSYRRTLQLIAYCRSCGVHLSAVPGLRFSTFGLRMRSALEDNELGPLLFCSLELILPKENLHAQDEDILSLGGLCYLELMCQCLGELDSVYARARSLGLNRPGADWVVAQLRFKTGLEALVQFNGLGAGRQVVFKAWSARACTLVQGDPADLEAQSLRLQLEACVGAVAGSRGVECSDERTAESHLWMEWIRQSAHLDREIFRREVNLG